MRISTGLTGRSAGWEQVLEQLGALYTRVRAAEGVSAEFFSVVAVTHPPDRAEAAALIEYLGKGGGIIGSAAALAPLTGPGLRREQVRYLRAETGGAFGSMRLLDVDGLCMIPREANTLRTDTNAFAVYAGPLLGGTAVILPFDPGALLLDDRAASRSFPFPHDRVPTERVSAVGKGALRHLMHAALEFLHHARGLPYVHRWHFPDGRRNCCVFRIDTDGAPERDVEDLYRLARDHGMPLTWFLDVAAHESWLRRFAGMVGQEFGVHCYDHVELSRADIARPNMERARQVMIREGLRPGGCAAPYGIWSAGFARVTRELGFLYSSEFSFAYDTVPLRTGDGPGVLQVPVHPICIGSLLRAGYAPDLMKRYLAAETARKLRRAEPLFFYHHPAHRRHDVVADLFGRVREAGIDGITMGEYAEWWTTRESWMPVVEYAEETVATREESPGVHPDRCWLGVSAGGKGSAILPVHQAIRLCDVPWTPVEPEPLPPELERVRDFDPRSMLGELFSTVSRKFR